MRLIAGIIFSLLLISQAWSLDLPYILWQAAPQTPIQQLTSNLASIGTEKTTIYLPPGNYDISAAITIPDNVALNISKGAIFIISEGITFTIDGDFQAGNYTVFSGIGKVNFKPGVAVNPVWFTSGGTGVDDGGKRWVGANGQGGIGEAISRVDGSKLISLPHGAYEVTNSINLNQDGYVIKGQGSGISHINGSKTKIFLNNANPTTLFNIDSGTMQWGSSIQGVMLACNQPTTGQHIGIKIVDNTHGTFRDIFIHDWHGKGIDVHGRELMTFENVRAYADFPLVINDNPNSTIDLDAAAFRDCFFRSTSTATDSASVTIASGVNLTHIIFNGRQTWMGGKYGLYWNDTTSTQVSQNINISNVKGEEGIAGGYLIYISHNHGLQSLNIIGCQSIERDNFVYLRKAYYPLLLGNYYWASAGVFLDINTTCRYVSGDSNFIHPTATINKGGMKAWYVAEGNAGAYERLGRFVYVYSIQTVTQE